MRICDLSFYTSKNIESEKRKPLKKEKIPNSQKLEELRVMFKHSSHNLILFSIKIY